MHEETLEARGRQNAVRERMAEAGIDVLVTGASAQQEFRGILRYLAAYFLPVFEEYIAIPLDGPVTFFAHDGSGAAYAANSGAVDDIRLIPGDEYNTDPGRCVAEHVRSLAPKSVGLAGHAGLSANFFRSFTGHLGDLPVTDFTPSLLALKMVKTPYEIALTEAAVRLNEDVFRHFLRFVKPGNREVDAVAESTAYALKNDGEDVYWMASSGPVPHFAYLAEARRRQHVWRQGDYNYTVLEHAATGGHWGEVTQLVSLGDPKPAYVKGYRALAEAQKAAAAAIRPGATVGSVADAAEKVLIAMGYAEPRPAGTVPAAIGHGQGVDVWEFPRIVSGNPTLIRPNMRFNLHPGIVLPDGARLTFCDCWLSTETGARRLSSTPYEIIVV